MSSFSKQIQVVPPLNPSKAFSDPPPFGFLVTTDHPFCSPENQVPPPPQAINNDHWCLSGCLQELAQLQIKIGKGKKFVSVWLFCCSRGQW